MNFIGCDSGFGHELAKCLDKLGVTVFAGCLFPESVGVTELKSVCSDKLHVLRLDVTKKEHIQNAVETIKNSLGVRCKYSFKVSADKIKIQKLNILNQKVKTCCSFSMCLSVALSFTGYYKTLCWIFLICFDAIMIHLAITVKDYHLTCIFKFTFKHLKSFKPAKAWIKWHKVGIC
jgi:hypothetical protein